MTTKEFDIAVTTFVEQFRTRALIDALGIRNDGGPGSGNFGHKGVEGQLGGSAPSGGSKNSYKAPETQMEKYALQDNDSATGFLMREGMGWKEAVALHDSGKALDKAKEVIDKRHKEQEARYEHASEGQKKLMRMSADTADKFVQECYKKPVDESLNRGSKTQHVVSELGIDAKPTVLGREEFEKAVAESPSGVMYRGVMGTGNLTAEEICKLTIESDKQYVGNGFHGDGTYFSTRLGTAAGYTHNPDGVSTGLMTACLSPDARIIDSRTLGAAYNDFQISDASTRALYMGYNVIAHEANRFADGTVEMYYITLDRSALCFLDEHQDAADDGKKLIDGQALADVWNAFIISSDTDTEKPAGVETDRSDEEPASWITLENGQHIPLNESGQAIGGAGGFAKGKDFSKSMSEKKEKASEKPGLSSSMKPAGSGYDTTLDDDFNNFVRKNMGNRRNPKGLYKLFHDTEDNGGDGVETVRDEYYKTRLEKCTEGLKEIGRDKADEILYDNLRSGTVNAWFREYNHEVKDALVYQMTQSPEVHNAALNVMYENYKYSCTEEGTDPLPFDKFLVTPIQMYRGGTGKEYEEASPFSSYTFSRKVAESFTGSEVGQGHAYDPNGVIYEAKIRPIDTYGSVYENGESEIMVPRMIAPNGNRDSADDIQRENTDSKNSIGRKPMFSYARLSYLFGIQ